MHVADLAAGSAAGKAEEGPPRCEITGINKVRILVNPTSLTGQQSLIMSALALQKHVAHTPGNDSVRNAAPHMEYQKT